MHKSFSSQASPRPAYHATRCWQGNRGKEVSGIGDVESGGESKQATRKLRQVPMVSALAAKALTLKVEVLEADVVRGPPTRLASL